MEENKKIGLSGLLFLAMGTFSTMPVLEVSAAGRSVTLFSLTFFAALVFLWVRNKNFLRTPILTKPLRYFVLWMVTGIVAGCAGWLYFNGDSVWQSAAEIGTVYRLCYPVGTGRVGKRWQAGVERPAVGRSVELCVGSIGRLVLLCCSFFAEQRCIFDVY